MAFEKLIKYSPEILTGIGISGFAGTVVLAVKTTPKAERLIAETNAKTFVEKTQATWKTWLPVVASGIGSAACVIGADVINHRRNVALMASVATMAETAAIAETAFSEYRKTVIDNVSEKKLEKIRDDFKERMEERKAASLPEIVVEDKEVYQFKDPDILCQEEYSGRYFMGNKMDIKEVCVELGRCLNGNFATMEYNEFLNAVGLDSSEAGATAGWISGDSIEPSFHWGEAPDGGPLLEVGFYKGPHDDFREPF